ncbi:MAG TPA: MotA/TolQ/ExbB proton channel family protein [Lacunisphaera sp.]|nr:MotA/TolQ/ExbB proton channel family protein [Lacunisphaera sp.]
MKRAPGLALLFVLACGSVLRATTPFDEAMKNGVADLRARMNRAADGLNQTRARIAAEKTPLLAQVRAAEDHILAAETTASRLDIRKEDSADQRRKLLQELEGLRKTTTFAGTLAHDSLKAALDGLAPGENQVAGERLERLLADLDDAAAGPSGRAAMDAAEFLASRLAQAVGGYRAEGTALLADNSQVVQGTFAFLGPETFFRPAQGAAGTVRPREGAKYPVNYALPQWASADAAAFFAGQPATIPADAAGGKALRLQQTRGTFWQHVQKGGAVAYAILAVGLVAALLILQKVHDLTRMELATPDKVSACLAAIARGDIAQAKTGVATLGRCTRELFTVGLASLDHPKAILEERLQSALLAQRLVYERRLPLLAVIATASPLMGLFGTVVGMVKTFALITVFGTGNAGKLSSGISEVLVATELGLAVAIPTLIIHGFLAHRIQKNLLQLERQALDFVTAVETARVAGRPGPVTVALP